MPRKAGPRLVNPEDRPVKEKIPYKTIVVTTVVSGIAGFLLAKALELLWEKGKKANPFGPQMDGNPAMAGAVGPQQQAFQSPYSQMAQNEGLPFPPAQAPEQLDEAPPKWAQAFIEQSDARMTKLEQGMGPRVVPSEEDAA